MSISGALSNAVSGLRVASRSAQLVSSNVANATNEGYGRREISLNTLSAGGVRVAGIERIVDRVTIADRRLADASLGSNRQEAQFFTSLEKLIGPPDAANSLGGRIAAFEGSLISAASRPESQTRLLSVLTAAKDVAGKIGLISDGIQETRERADKAIAGQIRQLNTALENVSELNQSIQRQIATGSDPSSLMDERQKQIDAVSELVTIKTIERDNGQLALFTENGTALIDGKPARFSFSPTSLIVAEMSVEAGSLSGLDVVGTASVVGDARESISGGSIAALFDIRDTHAVNAHSQLDAISRNLIERFADPALDGTIPASLPGLFTSNGGTFDPLEEIGLSSRLSVNVAADPESGGAVWRLRDGLGATSEGSAGDSALLNRYISVLNQNVQPSSGGFSQATSVSGLSSDFLSEVGTARQNAETKLSFASAQVSSLKDTELNAGVNTDQEMQKLLLIEQAFAANARVIQTIDEMMQSVLRI